MGTVVVVLIAALMASVVNVAILKSKWKPKDILVLVSSVSLASIAGQIGIHGFGIAAIENRFFAFVAVCLTLTLIGTYMFAFIVWQRENVSFINDFNQFVRSKELIVWLAALGLLVVVILLTMVTELEFQKVMIAICGSVFLIAWWLSFRFIRLRLFQNSSL